MYLFILTTEKMYLPNQVSESLSDLAIKRELAPKISIRLDSVKVTLTTTYLT